LFYVLVIFVKMWGKVLKGRNSRNVISRKNKVSVPEIVVSECVECTVVM